MRPDNCYTGTWKVKSNPLDIGYIYSDIHQQSRNKSKILFDVSWTTIQASPVMLFAKDFFVENEIETGSVLNKFRPCESYSVLIMILSYQT